MNPETKNADSTLKVAPTDPTESSCRKLAAQLIADGKNGQPVNTRAALAEHPEFGRFKSVMLDLAYEEYCQRIERGESIVPSQFCRRFPEFRKTLRQQLDIHRLISENGDLLRETVEAAFPQPDDEFLGFTIHSELGRGAFARVFLATEGALGHRVVSIKVALYGAAEAETLGKLQHPNIVPVHSFSQDELTGLTVICMPYLGRATLCDVLDCLTGQSALPARAKSVLDVVRAINEDEPSDTAPADNILRRGTYVDGVIYLGLKLSEALAYAHAAGILHLDLKPSNVLVTSEGAPMLLDFNLSFDEQIGEHKLGGTFPYMSPEQLLAFMESKCGAGLVDERSDIFSLGVILYELLSGQLPFGTLPDGVSSKQLAEHLYERRRAGARPLRALVPSLDEQVACTIDRCVAFDPDDRPQMAIELAGQLRQQIRLPRRARRWIARHPLTVCAVTAAIALLIIAAAVFYATRDPYDVREFKRGLAAYEQADYAAAVEHLNRSLAENPSVDALFARCRTRAKLGRFTEAAEDLETATRLAPDDQRWARFGREELRAGEEAFARGQYETALGHLNLSIAVDPDSPEAMFLRGRIQAKLDDYRGAVRDVLAAVKRTSDPRMMAFLGYCCNKARDHSNAVFWYELALENGFQSAAVYNNLGFSHLRRKRYDSALTALDSAIQLGGKYQPALHNRALVNFALAKSANRIPANAMTDIKQAIKCGKSTGELYRDAALIIALASTYDAQWKTHAATYVQLAIENGATPDRFDGFGELSSLFGEHLKADRQKSLPNAGQNYRASLLVDPIVN